jgi:hypothetical protein
MEQTATEWLIDEAMKLVVQYMQGTLNEDTLDDVIYKIGTKAKEMEKQQIIDAFVDGADKGEMFNNENRAFTTDALEYYQETFKLE